jgi:hypothetical protein
MEQTRTLANLTEPSVHKAEALRESCRDILSISSKLAWMRAFTLLL